MKAAKMKTMRLKAYCRKKSNPKVKDYQLLCTEFRVNIRVETDGGRNLEWNTNS